MALQRRLARDLAALRDEVTDGSIVLQPPPTLLVTVRGYVRGPEDPLSPFYKGYFSVSGGDWGLGSWDAVAQAGALAGQWPRGPRLAQCPQVNNCSFAACNTLALPGVPENCKEARS